MSLITRKLLSRAFRRQVRSFSTVPVIDISGYYHGSEAEKKAVAAQINAANTEIGFFAITNHGVSQPVIDTCWDQTKLYFDESVEEKEKILMSEENPYGYNGMSGESLAAGYGKDVNLADLNESMCIGPYNPAAEMGNVIYPENPLELKEAWTQYYQSMEVLSRDLLRMFALALDVEEKSFDEALTKHRSALRFLNYPPQEVAPKEGQVRAGEHTDYGAITILLQDNTGGLQVKPRSGEWQHVPRIPGAFMINIGDLMAMWTNDKWVSTPHRVINPPGSEEQSKARRQSIAYFTNLNGDYNVSCIPTCKSDSNPAKYADISAWDHLMGKHNASTN